MVGWGPSCPRYIEHTDCRADKLTSSPLSLDIQLRVANLKHQIHFWISGISFSFNKWLF